MAVKLLGTKTRIWTYRATGIVPANLESRLVEGAVRSAVNWNDTMLSWIKGTDVLEEELSDQQVEDLMTDFRNRLSGH